MKRTEVLQQIQDKINKNPESTIARENMDRIAALWSAYLGVNLSATNISDMMILQNIALAQNHSKPVGAYMTIAGYAAYAGEFSSAQE